MPTCVILPSDAKRGVRTPAGRVVAICPSQLADKVTCESCQLCQRSDRSFVIGFLAHGVAKRKAEKLTKEDIERRAMVASAVKAAHAA
jgi:hypothetical protein